MVSINISTQELTKDDVVYSLDEISKSLSNISPQEIIDVFLKYNVKLQRKVRMDAMRAALRPGIVRTRSECLTLDSRLNYRLLWFNNFSEDQMTFYFGYFKDKDLNKIFATKFLRNLIIFLSNNQDYKEALDEVIEIAIANKENPDKDIKIKDFIKSFCPFFVDEKGTLDGLKVDKFRPVIYNSATKEQVMSIGEKYGITVPTKINKSTIGAYVLEKLGAMGVDTTEFAENISKMQVKDIRKYALDNGLETGSELNKKEMIEYILQRADSTKDGYRCPESDRVYEMSIPISDEETIYERIIVEQVRLQEELERQTKELKKKHGEELEKAKKEIEEKEREKRERDDELLKMQEKFEQELNQIDDDFDDKNGVYEEVIAEEFDPENFKNLETEITTDITPISSEQAGGGALVVYETQRQDIMVLEKTREQKAKKFSILAIIIIILIAILVVGISAGAYIGLTKVTPLDVNKIQLDPINSTKAKAPDKKNDGKLVVSPDDFEKEITNLNEYYRNPKQSVEFKFLKKNGNSFSNVDRLNLNSIYKNRSWNEANTDYYVRVTFVKERKYAILPLEINFKNIISIYSPNATEAANEQSSQSTYMKVSDYKEFTDRGRGFESVFKQRILSKNIIQTQDLTDALRKDMEEWYFDSTRATQIKDKKDLLDWQGKNQEIRAYASNARVGGKNIKVSILGTEYSSGYTKYISGNGDSTFLNKLKEKLVYPSTEFEDIVDPVTKKVVKRVAKNKETAREYYELVDFVFAGTDEVFTTDFDSIKTDKIPGGYNQTGDKLYNVTIEPRFRRKKVILRFLNENKEELANDGTNRYTDVTVEVNTDGDKAKYGTFNLPNEYKFEDSEKYFANKWLTEGNLEVNGSGDRPSIPGFDIYVNKKDDVNRSSYIVKLHPRSGRYVSISVVVANLLDYKIKIKEELRKENPTITEGELESLANKRFSELIFDNLPRLRGKENETLLSKLREYLSENNLTFPSDFGSIKGYYKNQTDEEITEDVTFGRFGNVVEIRFPKVPIKMTRYDSYFDYNLQETRGRTFVFVRYYDVDETYKRAFDFIDGIVENEQTSYLESKSITDPTKKIKRVGNDEIVFVTKAKKLIINFHIIAGNEFLHEQVFYYNQKITHSQIPTLKNKLFKSYLYNSNKFKEDDTFNDIIKASLDNTKIDVFADWEARHDGKFVLTRVFYDENNQANGRNVFESVVYSDKTNYELGEEKNIGDIFSNYKDLSQINNFPPYLAANVFEYDETATHKLKATPTEDDVQGYYVVYFKRKIVRTTFNADGSLFKQKDYIFGQYINKDEIGEPTKPGYKFAGIWSVDGKDVNHDDIDQKIAGWNYYSNSYEYRSEVVFEAKFRDITATINAYFVKASSDNLPQQLDTSDQSGTTIKFSTITVPANQAYAWDYDAVDKLESLDSLNLYDDYEIDENDKTQTVTADKISTDGSQYNLRVTLKRKEIKAKFILDENDPSKQVDVTGVYADVKGFQADGLGTDKFSLELKKLYEKIDPNYEVDKFIYKDKEIRPSEFVFSILNNGSNEFTFKITTVKRRGNLKVYMIYSDPSDNTIDKIYKRSDNNDPLSQDEVIAKAKEQGVDYKLLTKKIEIGKKVEVFSELGLREGFSEYTNPFGNEKSKREITLNDENEVETYVFIKRAKYTVKLYRLSDISGTTPKPYEIRYAYCGATLNDYKGTPSDPNGGLTGAPLLPGYATRWVFLKDNTVSFDVLNDIVYSDLELLAL